MEAGTLTVGVLEDDEDQARVLRTILASAGFAVEWFRSVAEISRRKADIDRCAALVLDWTLPDGTAADVLRTALPPPLRRVPMIVLTARAEEAEVVAGLEAGADDYICKPARPTELIARIRTALARSTRSVEPSEDLSPYDINMERREISVRQAPVALTSREFDIAVFIFNRMGQAVTRKAIQCEVFKLAPQVISRGLDTHVCRLRRKLGLDGTFGLKLVSIYQTGYRLIRL